MKSSEFKQQFRTALNSYFSALYADSSFLDGTDDIIVPGNAGMGDGIDDETYQAYTALILPLYKLYNDINAANKEGVDFDVNLDPQEIQPILDMISNDFQNESTKKAVSQFVNQITALIKKEPNVSPAQTAAAVSDATTIQTTTPVASIATGSTPPSSVAVKRIELKKINGQDKTPREIADETQKRILDAVKPLRDIQTNNNAIRRNIFLQQNKGKGIETTLALHGKNVNDFLDMMNELLISIAENVEKIIQEVKNAELSNNAATTTTPTSAKAQTTAQPVSTSTAPVATPAVSTPPTSNSTTTTPVAVQPVLTTTTVDSTMPKVTPDSTASGTTAPIIATSTTTNVLPSSSAASTVAQPISNEFQPIGLTKPDGTGNKTPREIAEEAKERVQAYMLSLDTLPSIKDDQILKRLEVIKQRSKTTLNNIEALLNLHKNTDDLINFLATINNMVNSTFNEVEKLRKYVTQPISTEFQPIVLTKPDGTGDKTPREIAEEAKKRIKQEFESATIEKWNKPILQELSQSLQDKIEDTLSKGKYKNSEEFLAHINASLKDISSKINLLSQSNRAPSPASSSSSTSSETPSVPKYIYNDKYRTDALKKYTTKPNSNPVKIYLSGDIQKIQSDFENIDFNLGTIITITQDIIIKYISYTLYYVEKLRSEYPTTPHSDHSRLVDRLENLADSLGTKLASVDKNTSIITIQNIHSDVAEFLIPLLKTAHNPHYLMKQKAPASTAAAHVPATTGTGSVSRNTLTTTPTTTPITSTTTPTPTATTAPVTPSTTVTASSATIASTTPVSTTATAPTPAAGTSADITITTTDAPKEEAFKPIVVTDQDQDKDEIVSLALNMLNNASALAHGNKTPQGLALDKAIEELTNSKIFSIKDRAGAISLVNAVNTRIVPLANQVAAANNKEKVSASSSGSKVNKPQKQVPVINIDNLYDFNYVDDIRSNLETTIKTLETCLNAASNKFHHELTLVKDLLSKNTDTALKSKVEVLKSSLDNIINPIRENLDHHESYLKSLKKHLVAVRRLKNAMEDVYDNDEAEENAISQAKSKININAISLIINNIMKFNPDEFVENIDNSSLPAQFTSDEFNNRMSMINYISQLIEKLAQRKFEIDDTISRAIKNNGSARIALAHIQAHIADLKIEAQHLQNDIELITKNRDLLAHALLDSAPFTADDLLESSILGAHKINEAAVANEEQVKKKINNFNRDLRKLSNLDDIGQASGPSGIALLAEALAQTDMPVVKNILRSNMLLSNETTPPTPVTVKVNEAYIKIINEIEAKLGFNKTNTILNTSLNEAVDKVSDSTLLTNYKRIVTTVNELRAAVHNWIENNEVRLKNPEIMKLTQDFLKYILLIEDQFKNQVIKNNNLLSDETSEKLNKEIIRVYHEFELNRKKVIGSIKPKPVQIISPQVAQALIDEIDQQHHDNPAYLAHLKAVEDQRILEEQSKKQKKYEFMHYLPPIVQMRMLENFIKIQEECKNKITDDIINMPTNNILRHKTSTSLLDDALKKTDKLIECAKHQIACIMKNEEPDHKKIKVLNRYLSGNVKNHKTIVSLAYYHLALASQFQAFMNHNFREISHDKRLSLLPIIQNYINIVEARLVNVTIDTMKEADLSAIIKEINKAIPIVYQNLTYIPGEAIVEKPALYLAPVYLSVVNIPENNLDSFYFDCAQEDINLLKSKNALPTPVKGKNKVNIDQPTALDAPISISAILERARQTRLTAVQLNSGKSNAQENDKDLVIASLTRRIVGIISVENKKNISTASSSKPLNWDDAFTLINSTETDPDSIKLLIAERLALAYYIIEIVKIEPHTPIIKDQAVALQKEVNRFNSKYKEIRDIDPTLLSIAVQDINNHILPLITELITSTPAKEELKEITIFIQDLADAQKLMLVDSLAYKLTQNTLDIANNRRVYLNNSTTNGADLIIIPPTALHSYRSTYNAPGKRHTPDLLISYAAYYITMLTNDSAQRFKFIIKGSDINQLKILLKRQPDASTIEEIESTLSRIVTEVEKITNPKPFIFAKMGDLLQSAYDTLIYARKNSIPMNDSVDDLTKDPLGLRFDLSIDIILLLMDHYREATNHGLPDNIIQSLGFTTSALKAKKLELDKLASEVKLLRTGGHPSEDIALASKMYQAKEHEFNILIENMIKQLLDDIQPAILPLPIKKISRKEIEGQLETLEKIKSIVEGSKIERYRVIANYRNSQKLPFENPEILLKSDLILKKMQAQWNKATTLIDEIKNEMLGNPADYDERSQAINKFGQKSSKYPEYVENQIISAYYHQEKLAQKLKDVTDDIEKDILYRNLTGLTALLDEIEPQLQAHLHGASEEIRNKALLAAVKIAKKFDDYLYDKGPAHSNKIDRFRDDFYNMFSDAFGDLKGSGTAISWIENGDQLTRIEEYPAFRAIWNDILNAPQRIASRDDFIQLIEHKISELIRQATDFLALQNNIKLVQNEDDRESFFLNAYTLMAYAAANLKEYAESGVNVDEYKQALRNIYALLNYLNALLNEFNPPQEKIEKIAYLAQAIQKNINGLNEQIAELQRRAQEAAAAERQRLAQEAAQAAAAGSSSSSGFNWRRYIPSLPVPSIPSINFDWQLPTISGNWSMPGWLRRNNATANPPVTPPDDESDVDATYDSGSASDQTDLESTQDEDESLNGSENEYEPEYAELEILPEFYEHAAGKPIQSIEPIYAQIYDDNQVGRIVSYATENSDLREAARAAVAAALQCGKVPPLSIRGANPAFRQEAMKVCIASGISFYGEEVIEDFDEINDLVLNISACKYDSGNECWVPRKDISPRLPMPSNPSLMVQVPTRPSFINKSALRDYQVNPAPEPPGSKLDQRIERIREVNQVHYAHNGPSF